MAIDHVADFSRVPEIFHAFANEIAQRTLVGARRRFVRINVTKFAIEAGDRIRRVVEQNAQILLGKRVNWILVSEIKIAGGRHRVGGCEMLSIVPEESGTPARCFALKTRLGVGFRRLRRSASTFLELVHGVDATSERLSQATGPTNF